MTLRGIPEFFSIMATLVVSDTYPIKRFGVGAMFTKAF